MEEKTKVEQSVESDAYELAGFVTRALAIIIDGFLLLMALLIVIALLSSAGDGVPAKLYQVVSLAIPVGYYWYFWTRRDGQTPGKFALGIRVIKADGTAMSDTDAVIRAIGYHVSALLCGMGFIWAIFDKNNQTWHDKLARTYVVRNSDRRETVEIG